MVTTGYVDSLLAAKIGGIQNALNAYRAQARQSAPDFYAILSRTMTAGYTASSDPIPTTDATNTQALYAAMAEDTSSSDSKGTDLSSYADIMLNSLAGLQSEDSDLSGPSTNVTGFSDATALYANMLAKQLEEKGDS